MPPDIEHHLYPNVRLRHILLHRFRDEAGKLTYFCPRCGTAMTKVESKSGQDYICCPRFRCALEDGKDAFNGQFYDLPQT